MNPVPALLTLSSASKSGTLILSNMSSRFRPCLVEGALVEVVVVVVDVDVGIKTLIRFSSRRPEPLDPPNTYCSTCKYCIENVTEN